MERLDKRLASTGQWSRKEARELIRTGRVWVNGQMCSSPDQKVDKTAPVTVDGALIEADRPVYLMLHKPPGVVSATTDPQQPTVLSLLPSSYRRLGLFPVGRLDKDTEGLLLLTNDGPLAHRLLSPKRHVDKVYYLRVNGRLDEEDARAVSQGITLANGYTCLPGRLEVLGNAQEAYITIREGKYHQIKRMMAARNKPVLYLKRVGFGPLTLDKSLPKGGWRSLTIPEIDALFRQ